MKIKKTLLYSMLIVIVLLAFMIAPVSAEEKLPNFTAAQHCLFQVPVDFWYKNGITIWDTETESCYLQYEYNSCYPNWNYMTGYYKVYTSDGIYEDDNGKFVWLNTISGCAQLVWEGELSFRTPAFIKIENLPVGNVDIRDGDFGFSNGACNGICKISTTKLTPNAMRALDKLPGKVMKKAFVTILDDGKELDKGPFELCFRADPNKNPAFFRYNGKEWVYYGGGWSGNQFCLYGDISGNYAMIHYVGE